MELAERQVVAQRDFGRRGVAQPDERRDDHGEAHCDRRPETPQ